MRRRIAILVTSLIAVLGLGLALPGVAQARSHPSHATVRDRVGDAPAAIDLVSARYAISRKHAVFAVKVKDLGQRGLFAFESWPLTDGWDRLAVTRSGGHTRARVFWIDNSLEDSNQPIPHRVRCPGLTVSWNAGTNRISVVWPSRCMKESRPFYAPFQLHAFSRLGSVHDAAPPRTLDY